MANHPRRSRRVLEPAQASRPPAIPRHRPAAQKGQVTRAARQARVKKAPASALRAARLEKRVKRLEAAVVTLQQRVMDLFRATDPHPR